MASYKGLQDNYPENKMGKKSKSSKSGLQANYPENKPGAATKAREFFARKEALKNLKSGKMK